MGEIKKKCQVPTPPEIIIQMLDHIGYTQNLYGKRVLENSCGSGGFLTEIVTRYIQDCLNHNYTLEQISFGLSRDIHGFEKDRRLHKQCINKLIQIASGYGLTNIHWNIKRRNALTATKTRKYQFIIGNPPYLAFPELDQNARIYLRKHFCGCAKGKPDYYYAFIESAINALADDGKLAYLVPGNFMKNVFSEDLRQLILPSLQKIVDYSHRKLFNDVLTSSVILYCDKSAQDNTVYYEDVHYKRIYIMPKSRMRGKWIFCDCPTTDHVCFSDFFHACAPIATQLNRAFVISDWIEHNEQFVCVGNFEIEQAVLRDAASPKALHRNIQEKIIFPYRFDELGNIVRYTEVQFQEKFPGAYRHLSHFRNELLSRKADLQSQWFEYGRSQFLAHLNQDKLILSSFITEQPRVYLLSNRTIPYAGICIVAKSGYSITKAQDILTSLEFMEYVCKIGVCSNGVSYRISPTDINSFYFPRELLEV